MRILNLYAGIGGNRKMWGDKHDIVAVELDPVLAKIYQDHFPNDTVIVGDAQEYLLKHYKEFDLIWSSPPCQTHSSFRFNIGVRYRGVPAVMPDMSLWQEVIFLNNHAPKYWVVENVKPYYKPLIEPTVVLERHLFWTNFEIADKEFTKDVIRKAQIPQLQAKYGYDLSGYKVKNKRQVLRNCVEPEIGLHILEEVEKDQRQKNG